MSPCSKNPDRPLDYVTHRRLLKVRIVFVWPVSHEWDDFRVMSQCPSLTDAYSEAESSVLMFCSAKWFLPPAKACGIKVSFGTDGFRRLLTKLQLILKAFPVMCINPIANVELRTTKAAARLGPLVDLMGMDHKNLRTKRFNSQFHSTQGLSNSWIDLR